MRIILTAALLCMQVYVALAQSGIKHLVFFKDKSNNPYSLTDPREFLTKKALDRRVKNNIPFDEKDLPVSPAYVHELASKGARIIYTLKWFNAAMITTEDPHVLEAISELPFIEHITKVGGRNREMSKAEKGIQQQYSIQPIKHASLPSRTNSTPSGILNYGNAWNQVSMIGLHHLHDLGFTGQGKEIVILDAGYWNVDQGAAFAYLWQHGLILGTRDFVDPGGNVFIQHTHGESVLSILGANLPGQIIGTAPDASYWLLRTEDAWGGEYIEEEYNWAAGAEFADSVGADIITSSLAYTTFDNPASNHTYSDLDGNTTPAAIAADLSASRGILVVNCAGNLGEETWHYISTPADGDSVFTVGAVDESGVYQQFSGKGPTSDGQIKPDVVAQGCNTAIIYGNGVLTVGTGTSFSTPVVSGALACLWQSVSNVTAIDVMTVSEILHHMQIRLITILVGGFPISCRRGPT
jgi:subtilisin family serine protease